MARIVVLSDGETFSGVTGSAIFEVPDDWDADRIEAALKDEEIEPIINLRDEPAPLFSTRFSEEDVRALAEEAEVPFELAMERAEEWSSSIEDRLTELGNEQLLSVVRDGQP